MRVPNFIKPLDIDKERNEIIELFKRKSGKLDYIPLVGDDYMTLIDIFMYKINNFIELLNIKISNNYLNFSTGEYLDELVALIGIKRHREVKPVARVKVTVSSPTFLPKGTKFTDGAGHFAYLTQDVEIRNEASLKIEAGENFTQNYETTTLEIPNIYVSSIEMTAPFSGFKARESDEELRARFILALHRFSTAGSAKGYLFYVLSVEGIKKANVYRAAPGVVQIVYFSKFDEATAKAKIEDALNDRVPLCDSVRIAPAKQILLDLKIEVRPSANYMFSQILSAADVNIREYFSALDIGVTPHFSKIIEIAFDENCEAVEVKSAIPGVDRDSILMLNSLEISKASDA